MKNKNYNRSIPFMTNHVVVRWFDKSAFLKKYEVLSAVKDARSYGDNKNINYQDLICSKEIQACFIGKSKQPGNPHAAHFLVKRGDSEIVLKNLRTKNPSFAVQEYSWTEEGVWDIIRLLTLSMIFSPGEEGVSQMAFLGKYYLSSPSNFGLSVSKMQKVSMEISVDNHGLLVPKTAVFTMANLNGTNKGPLFVMQEPNRMSLVSEDNKSKYIKGGYTLYEKRNPFKKKIIPWLPFANGRVHEGKNHEAFWFIKRMNKVYGDFIKLEFKVIADYDIVCVEKKEITSNMSKYIFDMLIGSKIFITDMCNNMDSNELKKRILNGIQKQYAGVVDVTEKDSSAMEIQIVSPLPAPEDSKGFVDNYIPATGEGVVQHISYSAVENNDSVLSTIIDRLMLELAVKRSVITGKATQQEWSVAGWSFIILQSFKEKAENSFLFRNRVGCLVSDENGNMKYNSEELINTWGRFQTAINKAEMLGLTDTVFMMKHNKNVYALVDTMEVPVLNQEKILIDDQLVRHDTNGKIFFAYLTDNGITEEGIKIIKETLLRMVKKNKKGEEIPKYQGCVGPKILKTLCKLLPACEDKEKIIAVIKSYAEGMHFLARRRRPEFLEEFFGGYTNIHVWWEEPEKTFCYIPSIDPATLDMKESGVITTMPHTRKVSLISGSSEEINKDKDFILKMLKIGIGKYGAAMAYPYPYKILNEYLKMKGNLSGC